MDILQPETPELVRMLERKWTRTNRSGRERQITRRQAEWKKSLAFTWAVLEFEQGDGGQPPDIKISEVEEPRQSVSEVLREMRLKDET